ncbi:MAG: hypothetical protein QOD34_3411, partial [Mycobacterium sp.]|nr:hypothetical protein [Mycobacterium sp.]
MPSSDETFEGWRDQQLPDAKVIRT